MAETSNLPVATAYSKPLLELANVRTGVGIVQERGLREVLGRTPRCRFLSTPVTKPSLAMAPAIQCRASPLLFNSCACESPRAGRVSRSEQGMTPVGRAVCNIKWTSRRRRSAPKRWKKSAPLSSLVKVRWSPYLRFDHGWLLLRVRPLLDASVRSILRP